MTRAAHQLKVMPGLGPAEREQYSARPETTMSKSPSTCGRAVCGALLRWKCLSYGGAAARPPRARARATATMHIVMRDERAYCTQTAFAGTHVAGGRKVPGVIFIFHCHVLCRYAEEIRRQGAQSLLEEMDLETAPLLADKTSPRRRCADGTRSILRTKRWLVC